MTKGLALSGGNGAPTAGSRYGILLTPASGADCGLTTSSSTLKILALPRRECRNADYRRNKVPDRGELSGCALHLHRPRANHKTGTSALSRRLPSGVSKYISRRSGDVSVLPISRRCARPRVLLAIGFTGAGNSLHNSGHGTASQGRGPGTGSAGAVRAAGLVQQIGGDARCIALWHRRLRLSYQRSMA